MHRSLSFRWNKLESVPDAVCALTSLVSLDVSGNELKELPEALGRLVSGLCGVRYEFNLCA